MPHDAPGGSEKDELDHFLYLISHDVRAPIRQLHQISEWIAEDLAAARLDLPGSVSENLDLMKDRVERLDAMMRDLLDYSRVGRMQQDCRQPLRPLVDEVIASMTLPPSFTVKNETGEEQVHIGDTDIRSAIRALISNAVKHHDRATGELAISAHRHGTSLSLRFQDDGPGIPEESREKVKEPMTTLRSRDEIAGSGMGLALVDRIAQHYRGSLMIHGVDERSERGCCVELTLPAEN